LSTPSIEDQGNLSKANGEGKNANSTSATCSTIGSVRRRYASPFTTKVDSPVQ
jgi:hypothetical protein